ncbi:TPA: acetyltransferase, partial [Vibrio vulnificus]|nr:acetyltransferase [Vibrio vulnificus]
WCAETWFRRHSPLNAALCTFLKSFLQIKLVHSVIMR